MPRAVREPSPEETLEADEESGELALTLLDMMSGGTGSLPHERTLAADTLLRISYLIGIFKALTILHGRKLADEWMQLPNGNAIFAGETPLSFIMHGGLPAMQIVRRLLDARRAG